MWQTRRTEARSILSPVSGYLKEAGFTHSLSPARNCVYGCTYCYVPTMRIYAGLHQEDWERWGQFTTFKSNAAALAARELRARQVIYCSPLVDPYQPAERDEQLMPAILDAVRIDPPDVFVIQTRGPLILRDLKLLQSVSQRTTLRISFSITTNRDEVRKRYEPHCEPNSDRLHVIRELRAAGLDVRATLAPLLPCDPEELAELALDASDRDLIGDALHTRDNKSAGATTREAAWKIAEKNGELAWFQRETQDSAIAAIDAACSRRGKRFVTGPSGFALLAKPQMTS